MTSFSVVRKKTPFQKHREEEEAKKRRADEEAAKLYDEFVESFKADDTPGSKAFVRGGTINPNAKMGPEAVVAPKKPQRYVPSFIPPSLAAMTSKDKDVEKKKEEPAKEPAVPMKASGAAKIRNIDFFMEELKREQEARERRGERGDQRRDRKSGFDELPDDPMYGNSKEVSTEDGDPQTTNLYVGNLSPEVDENFLLRTFGRFGPIASVKIMWPRTEEERRRQRNCGFVAFMRRTDAQKAKDEMQNIVVYEYELRIGWGKAVNLPSSALPAPPPGQMAVRPKDFDVHGNSTSSIEWSEPTGGAPPSSVTGLNSEVVVTPNVPDILVVPPEDPHLRHIIDTTAMFVLDDGCAFEQSVMERGRGNPLFAFLFDLGSPEHTYYIWRLYSFAQGDTLQRWRTEPFIMITGSGRWMPPAVPDQEEEPLAPEKPSGTTFAAGRGRRNDLERALTDAQRDEFEDMLRALTLERSQIREAMAFSLDNAEAAGEVVEVLTESLTLLETPIPTKVARLMLVSDILHNSSAPVKNASAYRTGFQGKLPDIMESFNELYRSITGRITAEALKERVMKVLQVWSDRFLFSGEYVSGLRATFLRPGNSGVAPFHLLPTDGSEYSVATGVRGAEAGQVDGPEDKEAGNGGGAGAGAEAGAVTGTGADGAVQDTALAIGQHAAAQELASLPLIELERRCKFNGLSTRGGVQVMVARLLSLEAMEKAKNETVAEETAAAAGKEKERGALGGRGRGRSGWTEVTTGSGGWTEVSREPKVEPSEEESKRGPDGGVLRGSKWVTYGEDEERGNGRGTERMVKEEQEGGGYPNGQGGGKQGGDGSWSGGMGIGPLPSMLTIPEPQLQFGVKKEKQEKKEVVLPASKWSQVDDQEDEEGGNTGAGVRKGKEDGEGEKDAMRGGGLLGLGGYSSPESDAGKEAEDREVAGKEVNNGMSEVVMDEEKRQKLRKLELAVMEYREALEHSGLKSSFELEVKVAAHRKKLEAQIEAGTWPPQPGRGNGDGGEKGSSLATERGSLERKPSDRKEDKSEDRREPSSSRKRSRNHSRSRSRSRSPGRGKDRDKERDRDKSRDREREREKDKDRDKDKDRPRDKDRERDRDRDRDRGRDRDRDRDRGRDRERTSDRGKDKDRERDEPRDKSKDRDREKERSGKDRDRERERDREKERDKDRDKRSRRS